MSNNPNNVPIIEWQELVEICKAVFQELPSRQSFMGKFNNGIPAMPKDGESIVNWVEFYRENSAEDILGGTFIVRRGMKLTLFSLDYVTDCDK